MLFYLRQPEPFDLDEYLLWSHRWLFGTPVFFCLQLNEDDL
jgi:hypothetical protein